MRRLYVFAVISPGLPMPFIAHVQSRQDKHRIKSLGVKTARQYVDRPGVIVPCLDIVF